MPTPVNKACIQFLSDGLLACSSFSSGFNSPLSRPENMVHQTISSSSTSASSASNSIKPMQKLLRTWIVGSICLAVCWLFTACSSTKKKPPPPQAPVAAVVPVAPQQATLSETAPKELTKAKSKWVLASWADLPGFNSDNFNEAWVAWRQNCSRTLPHSQQLCADVNRLNGQAS